MALLQKLLTDRDEVIVLHRNSIYCSCGGKYQDLSDAENHLVQHPRVNVTKVNEVSKIIFNFLSKISIAAKNIGGDVNQNSADFELDFAILKEVNMPEKVFCITLEEEDLNAGDWNLLLIYPYCRIIFSLLIVIKMECWSIVQPLT